MKVAVICSHTGSDGIHPSGQHGGGEMYTFALLQILNRCYDLTAITPNGYYPAFESATDYGLDLSDVNWKPIGDSLDWVRQFDVQISLNHNWLPPALCRRNILVVFFPQYPTWDVSGYDTIVGITEYTAHWIKHYWGRDAEVVYPPVPVLAIEEATKDIPKENIILNVGRFFQVPDGNNKNHLVVLKTFKHLMLPDWQLHFVGAVQNRQYYEMIRRAAGSDERIHFHHNLNRRNYLELLGRAKFIWAATGYGAKKPSAKEHFGILATEGMAARVVPIVHNSGGTPEAGCLTWEEPGELVKFTGEMIDDPSGRDALAEGLREEARKFSLEEQGCKIIEIIEKPIVLRHDPAKAKIWVGPPGPSEIKVAMLSDSPMITTGFGVLTNMIGRGLREKGYNVVCWGMQDPFIGRPRYDHPFPVWTGCEHDPNGWNNLKRFIEFEQPDVLYLNYDPGNVRFMLDRLRSDVRCNAPIIAYIPIEGKFIHPQMIETLRLIRVMNGTPLLHTRWAVEAVKEAGGPLTEYQYYGCDHAAFRPLPAEEVKRFRYAVGVGNKFVCIFVGRNKRTKGFDALLHAARILKAQGHKDIHWYLHTNPDENIQNSSLPLRAMRDEMGLSDMVTFAPDLQNQTGGVPYDAPGLTGPVPDTDNIHEIRRYNMMALSMIERYNLARFGCFVNASEVEGFGLPTVEAMGCGVPVVSVDDAGVQREVLGDAPLYVPVSHWDRWHTGALLAQCNPQHLAEAILKVKGDDKLREDMIKVGLERHAQFKWQDVIDKIEEVIIRQVQV